MSDIRKQGGEGLHGWGPLACLEMAPDRVKEEPFGPYMRCVFGKCECKVEAEKRAKAQSFDPHFSGQMASGWR